MWFTGEYRDVVENELLTYTESMSNENGDILDPSHLGMRGLSHDNRGSGRISRPRWNHTNDHDPLWRRRRLPGAPVGLWRSTSYSRWSKRGARPRWPSTADRSSAASAMRGSDTAAQRLSRLCRPQARRRMPEQLIVR